MRIPAMNEIMVQQGHEPEYPDNHEEKRYMILHPEDYDGFGQDVAGNLAILMDEKQAREVRRLANDIIAQLEADDNTTTEDHNE